MIGIRSVSRYPGLALNARTLFLAGPRASLVRGYATESETAAKKKKKKSKNTADISQVPVKNIGVMADFYIPPRILNCPVTSWHKLLFRRLGMFVVNTYNVVKYKRETGLKLQFNDWKDHAIEQYVKTNKVFAAACNKRKAERAKYIESQLNDVAGVEVIRNLAERSDTFPTDSKLNWELVSIENNPKVVSFNVIPDSNNVTVYVQLIIKLITKQKVTVNVQGKENVTERAVSDYLVYSMDPITKEIYLVGKLFESDHIRKVAPDDKFTNPKYMIAFTKTSGDIYRANPKAQAVEAKNN
ncbi:assembly of mitochondrial respiratory complexes [Scheffersomyces xylosifermentans]|uniref:assembly of mitochondrial respiratory complexes n=1 Tax=Scheffersomyces xylosifermentans TaxID=1304137 RepID=UPI00315DFC0A